MRCESCLKTKLSNEFPGALSSRCNHCRTWCTRCLLQHISQPKRTCPMCSVALEDADLERLQAMLPYTQDVAAIGRDSNTAITIVLLGGESISVEFQPGMLVTELRDIIRDQLEVPPRRQRLSYDGHILTDSVDGVKQSLADFAVEAGQVMSLMVTPYTQYAGINVITGAPVDEYGNAAGAFYDLGEDGGFAGLSVAVIQLYTGEGFDFVETKAALEVKGFTVHHWMSVPDAAELARVLAHACQVWIMSGNTPRLGNDHIKLIAQFFERGGGVFIWGDNDPFVAECPRLLGALFGTQVSLSGNHCGPGSLLHLAHEDGGVGIPPHLITTGIETLYSGYTVAAVEGDLAAVGFVPIIVGEGRVTIAAIYDQKGKRAIIDGAFTRLYPKFWNNSAGTARYVKNAGAWLANTERLIEEGRF